MTTFLLTFIVLQLISFGVLLARLGQQRTMSYTGFDLLAHGAFAAWAIYLLLGR